VFAESPVPAVAPACFEKAHPIEKRKAVGGAERCKRLPLPVNAKIKAGILFIIPAEELGRLRKVKAILCPDVFKISLRDISDAYLKKERILTRKELGLDVCRRIAGKFPEQPSRLGRDETLMGHGRVPLLPEVSHPFGKPEPKSLLGPSTESHGNLGGGTVTDGLFVKGLKRKIHLPLPAGGIT
jgi:hypothetical protein